MTALLEENGAPTRPTLQINDGWVVDTTLSLPHLDRVLEDSEKIIAQRSGTRPSLEDPYWSYFQDLIATVADHIKCIPALSTTIPPGVRFVESNAAYDVQPDKPKDSQLYWGRKRGYRVSDEEVYSVASRKDAIEFCYPRGTVLFTDPSACSRDSRS